jgi:hypothetical protein
MEGSSPASVIAAIMERPAPSVAEVAPPTLDRVLKRCLEKDPDARWQSAQDLRAALELAGSSGHAPEGAVPPPPSRPSILPWAISALLALALLTIGWLYFHRERPAAETVRLQILPPAKHALADAPVVSPDGRQVAFVAINSNNRRSIWVRPLASREAKQVTSQNENDISSPFWSPDSRSLAYAADGKLKKLVAGSGTP